MGLYSFEKLEVWKEALELINSIYNVTNTFPLEEKFGLVSQFKRSSVSIASNLAEGTSRKTNKNKAPFTTISFSSSMKLLNQLLISKELNFLNENDYVLLKNQIKKITNMLNGLQNAQLNSQTTKQINLLHFG